MINSFFKTNPHTRFIVSLSLINDILLKINEKDIENFIENIHDLRENVLFMLSYEKLIRYEHRTERPILNDDE